MMFYDCDEDCALLEQLNFSRRTVWGPAASMFSPLLWPTIEEIEWCTAQNWRSVIATLTVAECQLAPYTPEVDGIRLPRNQYDVSNRLRRSQIRHLDDD